MTNHPPFDTWINLHFKSGLVRRAKYTKDKKFLSTDNDEWFSGYTAPEDVSFWDLVDDDVWLIYEDNWLKFDGNKFEVKDGDFHKKDISFNDLINRILGMGLNGCQSDDAIGWAKTKIKELKDAPM